MSLSRPWSPDHNQGDVLNGFKKGSNNSGLLNTLTQCHYLKIISRLLQELIKDIEQKGDRTLLPQPTNPILLTRISKFRIYIENQAKLKNKYILINDINYFINFEIKYY